MTRLVYSRSSLPDAQVCGRPYWWFHYLVIEDERVTILFMKQALLYGMNVERVEVQNGDDWRGLAAEQIVELKRHYGDDRLREVPKEEAARVLAWLDSRP